MKKLALYLLITLSSGYASASIRCNDVMSTLQYSDQLAPSLFKAYISDYHTRYGDKSKQLTTSTINNIVKKSSQRCTSNPQLNVDKVVMDSYKKTLGLDHSGKIAELIE